MTQTTTYLEQEISAATPQKLRLMLIDGAIRFARATLAHWEQGDDDGAETALVRCQAIIGELVRGVRAAPADCEQIVNHIRREVAISDEDRLREIDGLAKIGRDITAVYLVVLRDLQEAQLHRSSEKIQSALQVLEIERETARLVCEQLPTAPVFDLPDEGSEICSGQAENILSAGDKEASTAHSRPTYGDSHAVGASRMTFDA